jgi:hypothetical protein
MILMELRNRPDTRAPADAAVASADGRRSGVGTLTPPTLISKTQSGDVSKALSGRLSRTQFAYFGSSRQG